jgi:hypothetical protein
MKYGWHSKLAVKRGCGEWDWVTTDGNSVKVTAVTKDKDGQGYNWPDKTFVSVVTHIKD